MKRNLFFSWLATLFLVVASCLVTNAQGVTSVEGALKIGDSYLHTYVQSLDSGTNETIDLSSLPEYSTFYFSETVEIPENVTVTFFAGNKHITLIRAAGQSIGGGGGYMGTLNDALFEVKSGASLIIDAVDGEFTIDGAGDVSTTTTSPLILVGASGNIASLIMKGNVVLTNNDNTNGSNDNGYFGGAICSSNGYIQGGIIKKNTVADGSSNYGAGIYANNTTIVNSVFIGNTRGNSSSGIYFASPDTADKNRVINCTVLDELASNGVSESTVEVYNTIVALASITNVSYDNCAVGLSDDGSNIAYNSSLHNENGSIPFSSGYRDKGLVDTSESVLARDTLSIDILGNTRVVGDSIDIGAYEVQGTQVVAYLVNADSSRNVAYASLGEAVTDYSVSDTIRIVHNIELDDVVTINKNVIMRASGIDDGCDTIMAAAGYKGSFFDITAGTLTLIGAGDSALFINGDSLASGSLISVASGATLSMNDSVFIARVGVSGTPQSVIANLGTVNGGVFKNDTVDYVICGGTVTNSLLYGNATSSVISAASVWNCTVVNNENKGSSIVASSGAYNNIVWGNKDDDNNNANSISGTAADYNAYVGNAETNGISLNESNDAGDGPKFANITNNFTIALTSILIDAGSNATGAPATDIKGNTRSDNLDLGAYEMGDGDAVAKNLRSGQRYASLKAALEDAVYKQSGDTILLLASISEPDAEIEITEDHSVVIVDTTAAHSYSIKVKSITTNDSLCFNVERDTLNVLLTSGAVLYNSDTIFGEVTADGATVYGCTVKGSVSLKNSATAYGCDVVGNVTANSSKVLNTKVTATTEEALALNSSKAINTIVSSAANGISLSNGNNKVINCSLKGNGTGNAFSSGVSTDSVLNTVIHGFSSVNPGNLIAIGSAWNNLISGSENFNLGAANPFDPDFNITSLECIDLGVDTLYWNDPDADTLDFYGNKRLYGCAIDRGAVEKQSGNSEAVVELYASGATTSKGSYCSLYLAVRAAVSGDSLVMLGNDTVTSILSISKDIVINGAGNRIVRASSFNDNTLISIEGFSTDSATVILSNVTIDGDSIAPAEEEAIEVSLVKTNYAKLIMLNGSAIECAGVFDATNFALDAENSTVINAIVRNGRAGINLKTSTLVGSLIANKNIDSISIVDSKVINSTLVTPGFNYLNSDTTADNVNIYISNSEIDNTIIAGVYFSNIGSLSGCNSTLNNVAMYEANTYDVVLAEKGITYEYPIELTGAMDDIFEDPDNDNFELTANNICIDRGVFVDLGSVDKSDLKDLAGNARISHCTIDLGCYEYQKAGDPVAKITRTGEEYCSLATAVYFSAANDTIMLLANDTVNTQIDIDHSITLLAGSNINIVAEASFSDSVFVVTDTLFIGDNISIKPNGNVAVGIKGPSVTVHAALFMRPTTTIDGLVSGELATVVGGDIVRVDLKGASDGVAYARVDSLFIGESNISVYSCLVDSVLNIGASGTGSIINFSTIGDYKGNYVTASVKNSIIRGIVDGAYNTTFDYSAYTGVATETNIVYADTMLNVEGLPVSGSVVINAANATSSDTIDLAMNPRVFACKADMGAFEYQGADAFVEGVALISSDTTFYCKVQDALDAASEGDTLAILGGVVLTENDTLRSSIVMRSFNNNTGDKIAEGDYALYVNGKTLTVSDGFLSIDSLIAENATVKGGNFTDAVSKGNNRFIDGLTETLTLVGGDTVVNSKISDLISTNAYNLVLNCEIVNVLGSTGLTINNSIVPDPSYCVSGLGNVETGNPIINRGSNELYSKVSFLDLSADKDINGNNRLYSCHIDAGPVEAQVGNTTPVAILVCGGDSTEYCSFADAVHFSDANDTIFTIANDTIKETVEISHKLFVMNGVAGQIDTLFSKVTTSNAISVAISGDSLFVDSLVIDGLASTSTSAMVNVSGGAMIMTPAVTLQNANYDAIYANNSVTVAGGFVTETKGQPTNSAVEADDAKIFNMKIEGNSSSIGLSLSNGATAANCLIAENRQGVSLMSRSILVNATVVGNTSGGVLNNNSYVYNSIICDNTSSNTSGDGIYADTLTSNPGFVDAPNGDYTLSSFAANAINTGDNANYLSSYPKIDFAGNVRIQTTGIDSVIDLGCYESSFERNIMVISKRTGAVDTIYYANMQEAIDGCESGDTIKLTSNLDLPCDGVTIASNDSIILSTVNGDSIFSACDSVMITVNGALILDNVVIDGEDSPRKEALVVVTGGDASNEAKLYMQNGAAITGGNNVDGCGGAIRGKYAHLVDVNVYENAANYGGGICLTNSMATLYKGEIFRNGSTLDGAGIYADSSVVVGCNVYENVATVNGGGIYAHASVITNTKVYDNNAVDGGAIYADSAIIVNTLAYEDTTNSGAAISAVTYSQLMNITVVYNVNSSSECAGVTLDATSSVDNSIIRNNKGSLGTDGVADNINNGTNVYSSSVNSDRAVTFADASVDDYSLSSTDCDANVKIVNLGNSSKYFNLVNSLPASADTAKLYDLAGSERLVGTIDLGCFESECKNPVARIYTNRAADLLDFTAYTSLQAAIDDAINPSFNDTIYMVDNDTINETLVFHGEFFLTTDDGLEKSIVRSSLFGSADVLVSIVAGANVVIYDSITINGAGANTTGNLITAIGESGNVASLTMDSLVVVSGFKNTLDAGKVGVYAVYANIYGGNFTGNETSTGITLIELKDSSTIANASVNNISVANALSLDNTSKSINSFVEKNVTNKGFVLNNTVLGSITGAGTVYNTIAAGSIHGSDVKYSAATNLTDGENGNINISAALLADAVFADASNTQLLLNDTSICMNAGSSDLYNANVGVRDTLDAAYADRIYGCGIDMGAFEVNDIVAINRLLNLNDSVYYCELQEAIDAATAGDTIALLRDIVVDATVNVNKNITIRDNDKWRSITRSSDIAIFNVTDTLNIKSNVKVDGEDSLFTSSLIVLDGGASNDAYLFMADSAVVTGSKLAYAINADSAVIVNAFVAGNEGGAVEANYTLIEASVIAFNESSRAAVVLSDSSAIENSVMFGNGTVAVLDSTGENLVVNTTIDSSNVSNDGPGNLYVCNTIVHAGTVSATTVSNSAYTGASGATNIELSWFPFVGGTPGDEYFKLAADVNGGDTSLVNKGNDALYFGLSFDFDTDFLGNDRFVGCAIDLGAVEYQSLEIDNSDVANVVYNKTNGLYYCSLADAVADAAISDGDTIWILRDYAADETAVVKNDILVMADTTGGNRTIKRADGFTGYMVIDSAEMAVISLEDSIFFDGNNADDAAIFLVANTATPNSVLAMKGNVYIQNNDTVAVEASYGTVLGGIIRNNSSTGEVGAVSLKNESTLANSLLYGNTSAKASIYADGSKIINSTVIAQDTVAVTLSGTNTVSNNIIVGNDADIAGNSVYSQTSEVLFTDPAINDYSLTCASLCVNAGDNTNLDSAWVFDLLGNDRIQRETVDMGAIESPYFHVARNVRTSTFYCTLADAVSEAIASDTIEMVAADTVNSVIDIDKKLFIRSEAGELNSIFASGSVFKVTSDTLFLDSVKIDGLVSTSGELISVIGAALGMDSTVTIQNAKNGAIALDNASMFGGVLTQNDGVAAVIAAIKSAIYNTKVIDNNLSAATDVNVIALNGSELVNALVVNNTTSSAVVAISADSSKVVNATVYGNSGLGLETDADALVANSIIWGNNGGETNSQVKDLAVGTFIHNSISDITTPDDVNFNASFDPAFEGALGLNFRIGAGGECFQKGIDSLYLSTYPTIDLAGEDRVKTTGSNRIIDLGAYESPYTCRVFLASDPFSCYGNLQTAIDMAIEGDTIILNDTIYIGPGCPDATTVATDHDEEGNHLVTIIGNGFPIRRADGFKEALLNVNPTDTLILDSLTIDGCGIKSSKALVVVKGDNHSNGGYATLLMGDSVFVQNNIDTASVVISANQGAGIYGEYATIKGGVVRNNKMTNGNGGGIFITNSTATLYGTTVYGNTAIKGGGIYATTSNVKNVTVYDNSAKNGGGVYITGEEGRPISLVNSLVYGNTATDAGAGVYADNNSSVVNTTIVENNGEGIKLVDGSSKLLNSVVWNNTGAQFSNSGTENIANSAIQGYTADETNKTLAEHNYSDDNSPRFRDPDNHDYRLSKDSWMMINYGKASYYEGATTDVDTLDLAGQPRVKNVIDLGCYEAPFDSVIRNEREDHIYVHAYRAFKNAIAEDTLTLIGNDSIDKTIDVDKAGLVLTSDSVEHSLTRASVDMDSLFFAGKTMEMDSLMFNVTVDFQILTGDADSLVIDGGRELGFMSKRAVFGLADNISLVMDSAIFVGNNYNEFGNGGVIAAGEKAEIEGGRLVNSYAAGNGGAIAAGNGLSVKNTLMFNDSAYVNGGAVYAIDNLSIEGAAIVGSKAVSGGAIYAEDSAHVAKSIICKNIADNGGAVAVSRKSFIDSCFIADNAATLNGGAVYSYNLGSDSILVVDSRIENNTANKGGAIYVNNYLTVFATYFEGNKALSGNGGAIYANDTLTVDSVAFINNTASENGGAIYANKNNSINNIFAVGDSAKYGGAIYIGTSNTITNSKIDSCFASKNGGGIYAEENSKVYNTAFVGDSATENGGAAYTKGVEFVNCLMQGNKAAAFAAAVIDNGLGGSNVGMTNCTVIDNVSSDDAVVNATYADLGSTPKIANSIFDNNTEADIKGRFNIYFSIFDSINGAENAESNYGSIDPMLNSDGSLSDVSPAIGAGDTATWYNSTKKYPELDIADSSRIVCRIDLGAYEYQGINAYIAYIKRDTSLYCSLREAVAAALTNDTIVMLHDDSVSFNDLSTPIALSDSADKIVIEGEKYSVHRDSSYTGVMFSIVAENTVILNNVTFNGRRSESVAAQQPMFDVKGSLIMNDSTFLVNNHNAATSNALGGAIYASENALVEGGIIAGNEAKDAGAGIYAADSAIIRNVTVVGNNVTPAVSLVGNAVLANSIVANNNNGGIDAAENAQVVNATVVSNSRDGVKAAGSSRIRSSIVWNNDEQIFDSKLEEHFFSNAVEGILDLDSPNDNFPIDSVNMAFNGPRFVNPTEERGMLIGSLSIIPDWHIADEYSVCINAGDTLTGVDSTAMTYEGSLLDMSGNSRVTKERVDVGAFEYTEDFASIAINERTNTVYPSLYTGVYHAWNTDSVALLDNDSVYATIDITKNITVRGSQDNTKTLRYTTARVDTFTNGAMFFVSDSVLAFSNIIVSGDSVVSDSASIILSGSSIDTVALVMDDSTFIQNNICDSISAIDASYATVIGGNVINNSGIALSASESSIFKVKAQDNSGISTMALNASRAANCYIEGNVSTSSIVDLKESSMVNSLVVNNNETTSDYSEIALFEESKFINNTVIGDSIFAGTDADSILNTIVWGGTILGNGAIMNTAAEGITENLLNSVVALNSENESHNGPFFIDPVNGDYRLQTYSIALNKGNNDYVTRDIFPSSMADADMLIDYNDSLRIQNRDVDMGAFEATLELPVARVIDLSADTTVHPSVNHAIFWASVNDTVELMNNDSVAALIPFTSKNLTLRNSLVEDTEFSIFRESGYKGFLFDISNHDTLTMANIEVTGIGVTADTALIHVDGASLIMDDSTFVADASNGGIIADSAFVFGGVANSADVYATNYAIVANMTMNISDLSANYSAIVVNTAIQSADVEVNKATFINNSTYKSNLVSNNGIVVNSLFVTEDSEVKTVTGDSITYSGFFGIDLIEAEGNRKLDEDPYTVEDHTISIKSNSLIVNAGNTNAYLNMFGYLDTPEKADQLAQGYPLIDLADSARILCKIDMGAFEYQAVDFNVAQNIRTGKFYCTLAEAVSDAECGDTITLLRDEYVSEEINVTCSVTVMPDSANRTIWRDPSMLDKPLFNVISDRAILSLTSLPDDSLFINGANFLTNETLLADTTMIRVDGATLQLDSNVVVLNAAAADTVSKSGANGGAIYAVNATVTGRGRLSNNIAANGGAIYADGSSISNLHVSDNIAVNNGGAIYAVNGSDVDSLDVVRNEGLSLLSGEYHTPGAGAIYLDNSTVRNSLVYENSSKREGGAVYANNGSLIVNTLVAGNYADGVGGIYLKNSTAMNVTVVRNTTDGTGTASGIYTAGTSTIVNSIIWGNGGSEGNSQVLMSSSSTITYSAVMGSDTIVGEGNIALSSNNKDDLTSPYFTNPSAFDFTLEPYADSTLTECRKISPAINAGNTDAYTGGDLDLADSTRIICKIDMGAYESKWNPTPAIPEFAETPEANICIGDTVTYEVNPVCYATNYSWILPEGFEVISAATDSISIEVVVGDLARQTDDFVSEDVQISVLAFADCKYSEDSLKVVVNVRDTVELNVLTNPDVVVCVGSESDTVVFDFWGAGYTLSWDGGRSPFVDGDRSEPLTYGNEGDYKNSDSIYGLAINVGEFKYTVEVSDADACGQRSFTGTVTVNDTVKFAVVDSSTLNQVICLGQPIEPIVFTYNPEDSLDRDVTALLLPNEPGFNSLGLYFAYGTGVDTISNTFTISGTPNRPIEIKDTVYANSVNCPLTNKKLGFEFTVRDSVKLISDTLQQIFCLGEAIEPIHISANRATKVTVSGLPDGVSISDTIFVEGGETWRDSVVYVISGTPEGDGAIEHYDSIVTVMGTSIFADSAYGCVPESKMFNIELAAEGKPIVADFIIHNDTILNNKALNLPEVSVDTNATYYEVINSGWELTLETGSSVSYTEGQLLDAETYDGAQLRYFAENNCGKVYGDSMVITIVGIPVIADITSPAPICDNKVLDLTVPSIDWKHADEYSGTRDLIGEQWEVSQFADFSIIEAYVPSFYIEQHLSYKYNGYYIRYKATTPGVAETVTNSVVITVNHRPIVADIEAPAAISAGQSLILTVPAVNERGSEVFTQGWVLSQSGDFNTDKDNSFKAVISNTGSVGDYYYEGESLSSKFNGYYLAYRAQNECGYAYSNAVRISIVEYDTVSAVICAGSDYTEYGFNLGALTAGTTITLDSVYTTDGVCDSAVVINLTVLPEVQEGKFANAVCQSECGRTFESHGFVFTKAEIDSMVADGITTFDTSRTVQTANGCDSTITLTLSIYPTIKTTVINASTCQGGTFECDGFKISASQTNLSGVKTFTNTYESANGCDSTVQLILTVNLSSIHEITDEVCEGMPYESNGFAINNPVTGKYYSKDLKCASGCDSLVILNLVVNKNTSSSRSASVCQGEKYEDAVFNIPATEIAEAKAYTFTETIENSKGCDSIVTLYLTVNPTAVTEIEATICAGDTYTDYGFNASTAGRHEIHLETVNGCDSTVVLNLTVNQPSTSTLSAWICQGSSYSNASLGVSGLSTAGSHEIVLEGRAANGCDSIVTLVLEVRDQVAPVLEVAQQAHGFDLSWTGEGNLYSIMRDGVKIAETSSTSYSDMTNISDGATYKYQILSIVATCRDASSLTVTTGAFTDAPVLGDAEIRAYPNPADNYVNITGKNIDKVTVINSVGQIVGVYKTNDPAGLRVPVIGLHNGAYLFHISTTDGNDVVKQIIVATR